MLHPMSIARRLARRLERRSEPDSQPFARRIAMLVAIAAAVGIGASGSAQAATLASGILWSEDAKTMVCSMLNIGSTPVKVLSSKMVDSSGGAIFGYNGCFNKTIQPGQQCGFVVETQQAAGIFEIDSSKSHVRGVCQLLANGNVSVAVTEMR